MNKARALSRFQHMSEVFPDLNVLRGLSTEGAKAVWEFLTLAVFIDGHCSEWEETAMQMIGAMMPNLPHDTTVSAPKAAITGRERRKKLQQLARTLGEDQREAAFKMLCVLSTIDELDLDEIDFVDEAAAAFGIDKDLSEHMLRSSWESCRAHYYAA